MCQYIRVSFYLGYLHYLFQFFYNANGKIPSIETPFEKMTLSSFWQTCFLTELYNGQNLKQTLSYYSNPSTQSSSSSFPRHCSDSFTVFFYNQNWIKRSTRGYSNPYHKIEVIISPYCFVCFNHPWRVLHQARAQCLLWELVVAQVLFVYSICFLGLL